MCPANIVIHFSDFLELPRPIVAADFTHRQSGVEQLHEALWVQLQIAEQRFHTWKNIKNVKISKTLGVVVVCWILEFLGKFRLNFCNLHDLFCSVKPDKNKYE